MITTNFYKLYISSSSFNLAKRVIHRYYSALTFTHRCNLSKITLSLKTQGSKSSLYATKNPSPNIVSRFYATTSSKKSRLIPYNLYRYRLIIRVMPKITLFYCKRRYYFNVFHVLYPRHLTFIDEAPTYSDVKSYIYRFTTSPFLRKFLLNQTLRFYEQALSHYIRKLDTLPKSQYGLFNAILPEYVTRFNECLDDVICINNLPPTDDFYTE
jgi:hypothetical protein